MGVTGIVGHELHEQSETMRSKSESYHLRDSGCKHTFNAMKCVQTGCVSMIGTFDSVIMNSKELIRIDGSLLYGISIACTV